MSKAIASAGKPRHIAIIMDGNGRWANERGLDRTEGHRQGIQAAHDTVIACQQRGIQTLTLFAFSTDNWRRPKPKFQHLLNYLPKV